MEFSEDLLNDVDDKYLFVTVVTSNPSYNIFSKAGSQVGRPEQLGLQARGLIPILTLLADPGKAKGSSTNTSVINW